MGGYRVQGRTGREMKELLADAAAIEGAGAVALVLEGIPRELAEQITDAAKIPTIGIGAGPGCNGQILVFHDAFELTFAPPAKFVRSFADGGTVLREGIERYRDAVIAGRFPSDAESYHLPREVSSSMHAVSTPVSLVS
jgi:3-methyl-2-oxobutanoate hydroxymethyltransferase